MSAVLKELEAWLPVVVAIASGLALLAYRHRQFFVRLSAVIQTTIMLILIGGAIWNAALQKFWGRLLQLPDPTFKQQAVFTDLWESLQFPLGWMIVIAAAVWAYSLFLTALPKHDE